MSAGKVPLPVFELAFLREDTDCSALRCKSREITKWFSDKALKCHNEGSVRVRCALDLRPPNKPLGFYAVATVAEELSNLPGPYHRFRGGQHFSALQLVWLATDEAFQGQGLGSTMVGDVIRLFARIGPEIGLPHLIVIPDPDDYDRLFKFYKKLNFVPYKDGEAMFLSLPLAIDAVQKARFKVADAAAEARTNS